MPDAVVPQQDAIERLVAMVRKRLEDALRNGQRVTCHAREGMKRGSFTETDGSFTFSMHIDPKP